MSDHLFLQGITPDQLNEKIQEGIRAILAEFLSGQKPQQPNEYLTRKEAREMLSVSYPTLNDWVKKGTLKAFRMESRLYFRRSDVEAAMKPVRIK